MKNKKTMKKVENKGFLSPTILISIFLVLATVAISSSLFFKANQKKMAPGETTTSITVAYDVPIDVDGDNLHQPNSESSNTESLIESTAETIVEVSTESSVVSIQQEPIVQEDNPPALEEPIPAVETSSANAVVAHSWQPYQLSINGISQNYKELGLIIDTDLAQREIDNGHIISQLTNFDPNDGQTTYFGGHNPGIMKYMEDNLNINSIVTVTDGHGNPFNYRAVDHAIVDVYGTSMLNTIGMSVIDVYSYGSGQESIIIQYCQSHGGLMNMWYLIPA